MHDMVWYGMDHGVDGRYDMSMVCGEGGGQWLYRRRSPSKDAAVATAPALVLFEGVL